MKAAMHDSYGAAEVLDVREVDLPSFGPGEVLVRVKAAGVNMADWHLMTGEPWVARLFLGLRRPKSPTRGMDFAGVIEEVGPGVTEWAPGDEVFGSARGAFAELAIANAARIGRKPASVSFEHAAATPIAGDTALVAVRDKARVSTGDRVLVIGAAGGVGSFSVQLAKYFGAHVTGVCSTSKVELVRSLGADAVIDYAREQLTGEFDAIIDTAGSRPLSVLRSLLATKGVAVIVGGEGGGRMFGTTGRSLRAALMTPFVTQRLVGLLATEKHDDLVMLASLLESEAIAPPIDRVFPLAEAPDAIRHLEQGRAAGKVIVVP